RIRLGAPFPTCKCFSSRKPPFPAISPRPTKCARKLRPLRALRNRNRKRSLKRKRHRLPSRNPPRCTKSLSRIRRKFPRSTNRSIPSRLPEVPSSEHENVNPQRQVGGAMGDDRVAQAFLPEHVAVKDQAGEDRRKPVEVADGK